MHSRSVLFAKIAILFNRLSFGFKLQSFGLALVIFFFSMMSFNLQAVIADQCQTPDSKIAIEPMGGCGQVGTGFSETRCRKVRAVEIAFLSVSDSNGNPIDLEPEEVPKNLPIAHVAIRWRGEEAWLHAHPSKGVQWSTSLSRFGQVREIVESVALSSERYRDWVGRAYDPYFRWDDAAFYCSELVGKILGEVLPLQPLPMRFEGDYWDRYFKQLGVPPPHGVGISPKAIYRAVSARP